MPAGRDTRMDRCGDRRELCQTSRRIGGGLGLRMLDVGIAVGIGMGRGDRLGLGTSPFLLTGLTGSREGSGRVGRRRRRKRRNRRAGGS